MPHANLGAPLKPYQFCDYKEFCEQPAFLISIKNIGGCLLLDVEKAHFERHEAQTFLTSKGSYSQLIAPMTSESFFPRIFSSALNLLLVSYAFTISFRLISIIEEILRI